MDLILRSIFDFVGRSFAGRFFAGRSFAGRSFAGSSFDGRFFVRSAGASSDLLRAAALSKTIEN